MSAFHYIKTVHAVQRGFAMKG